MASERARALREGRRRAMFQKFGLVQLNLIPLVDTFVAIVFFSLTAATVGDLAPILNGVTLPQAKVGAAAHQELTLGVSSRPAQVIFNGRPLMTVSAAASAVSNVENQPLVVPQLYAALKTTADSIRQANGTSPNESVTTPLAIQGDKTMRYDLLQRLLQSARLAGFRTITLQVQRATEQGAAPTVTM
ncbi:MAG TPA: biopolymer transporter ExbD [Gemmatimonadaceae bacterium]|nr:biopolymer transporter ExbD [Gemmatimonadaceae bacterium]